MGSNSDPPSLPSIGRFSSVEDASLKTQRSKSRSIGKRFTYALIGVVTLLLVGFAAVAILINVRKIDADLQDRLDNAAKLAQVTVASPCGISMSNHKQFCRRFTAG